MKKIIKISAVLFTALSLVACSNTTTKEDEPAETPAPTPTVTADVAEDAVIFDECETLEEAEKIAGFEATVAEGVGYVASATEGGIAIAYTDEDGAPVEIRKTTIAKMFALDDLFHDAEDALDSMEFPELADGRTVLLCFNEEGKIICMQWFQITETNIMEDDEFVYAMYSTKGIDAEHYEDIITVLE